MRLHTHRDKALQTCALSGVMTTRCKLRGPTVGMRRKRYGLRVTRRYGTYWCRACWEVYGIRIRNRRLSSLQQRILRWLKEDIIRAPSGTASSKALAKDKGNISESLRYWIKSMTPCALFGRSI